MPWERIGPCGGDGKPYESEWGTLTRRMGLSYVRFLCGEPPYGCRLSLHWFTLGGTRQHEIALFWDPKQRKGAPRRYIWRCEEAAAIFDETVPWRRLRPDRIELRSESLGMMLRRHEREGAIDKT